MVIDEARGRKQSSRQRYHRPKLLYQSQLSQTHVRTYPNAPDQAARRPVTPMSVKIMVRATVAMPTPIYRSLSVFEAKVRIQNPDTKKSLVRMATGSI